MVDIRNFDAEELLALARLDLGHGRLEEALHKLKAGLEREEHPAEFLALLGALYAQLGLLPRAERYLMTYLQQHPEASTERFRLGMVAFDRGEPRQALEIWRALLQSTPTHPPTLYYSALACCAVERVSEAKRHLEVLLKSAEEDNLYFLKASELLAAINAGATIEWRSDVALRDRSRQIYGSG